MFMSSDESYDGKTHHQRILENKLAKQEKKHKTSCLKAKQKRQNKKK